MSLEQILIFVTEFSFVYLLSCGKQYVKRGNLCCIPVFNCEPGYSIVPCSEMYGSETCTICPQGYVQPDFISSLDHNRDCFLKKRECTAYDMAYSKERDHCYPKYCKCNKDRCYKNEHCVCVKVQPCPVNQTLNPITGACAPCSKFAFKHKIGCGPCTMDTEAWINDQMLKERKRRHHNLHGRRKRLRYLYKTLRRVTKMLRGLIKKRP